MYLDLRIYQKESLKRKSPMLLLLLLLKQKDKESINL
jgi:hypothetical protein